MTQKWASAVVVAAMMSVLVVMAFVAGSLPIESDLLKGLCGFFIVGIPVLATHGALRRLLPVKCPKCQSRMKYFQYLRRKRDREDRTLENYRWLFGYICPDCEYETLREHDTG